MSNVCVISFGTTYPIKYATWVEELKLNCEELGIEHDVQVIPDQGGYKSNNHYKPTFIYSMLLKHKKPVVWFDVDGSWKKPPNVTRYHLTHTDVGLVASPRMKEGDTACLIWTCGCILFNWTADTLSFVSEWAKACNSDLLHMNEHRYLMGLIGAGNDKTKFKGTRYEKQKTYDKFIRIKDVSEDFEGCWTVDSRREDRVTYEG